MTSRSKGIDVTVPGTPDGFTLMATMSDGTKNFAQASFDTDSPVRAFMPSSTITRTAGCETRRSTSEPAWCTCTTRPGKSPGMPSGDRGVSGACTSIFRDLSAEPVCANARSAIARCSVPSVTL